MASREIDLDNNATTQPLPEVRDAVAHALLNGLGNPSSIHAAGQRARDALRTARHSLASLIAADPAQLVFTSGATEANNLVLFSAPRWHLRPRIVTTAVEHSSILRPCEVLRQQGADVVTLPVNHHGLVDLDQLAATLTPDTTLVSIQWANSETGVIQPLAAIAALCRSRQIPFHTDAAQAVGKLPVSLASVPVDFLSLSGHKFHAPMGTGALFARQPDRLRPLLWGGDQEHALRAGTENLPGLVGLGVAATLRQSRFAAVRRRLQELRDRFETLVLEHIPDVVVNGAGADRLVNTTNLQFPGVDGQALVARLDQAGIACSQTTACTTGRPEPSAVLRAMGLSEEQAYASVRFAVSEWTTSDDVETAARTIAELCESQRSFLVRHRRAALPLPRHRNFSRHVSLGVALK